LPGAAAGATPPPAPALAAVDIIELDICYTTMMARFYRPVTPVQLFGGARTGVIAYLKEHGVDDPQLPAEPAKIDQWRAEDALTRDVAYAILKYPAHVVPDQIVLASCSGQLSSVHDPYTVLFRPTEFKGFNAFLGRETFGGIGVLFARQPSADGARAGPVVQDVFPGSPAEKAGLAAGDTIVSIDGEDAAPLTPEELQTRLRGKVGTTVTIGVRRAGNAQPLALAVVRAEVTPPEVSFRMLTPAIGYLQLRTFGVDAGKQVAHGLERLRALGARSYILDLRNNGGGFREQSVDVASQFVGGTILSQQERTGRPVYYKAKDVARLGAPLAVLVNGDTASGSEIVAAAIQDEKAGTIVGTKTFGKGLVQEIYPLPDGSALKITTARYLTAGGRDINEVGVVPDITVDQPAGATIGTPGSDAQLDRAIAILTPGP
jgi:carboxyl-terminal processing protease